MVLKSKSTKQTTLPMVKESEGVETVSLSQPASDSMNEDNLLMRKSKRRKVAPKRFGLGEYELDFQHAGSEESPSDQMDTPEKIENLASQPESDQDFEPDLVKDEGTSSQSQSE
jgi:hypothetical protein